jgi:uncharacterized protein YyaL (SSP411 family)
VSIRAVGAAKVAGPYLGAPATYLPTYNGACVNRLAASTSPYLRQHADNPVDWREWGEDAFAEARERDVPIFLSVGYSACHWCHVMAHECCK